MTSNHLYRDASPCEHALALGSSTGLLTTGEPASKGSRLAIQPRLGGSSSRCGHTLVELILVMIIMALASMMGIRQFQLMMDRLATRDAVRSASVMVSRARDEAMALHTPVSLRIDTITSALELRSRDGAIALALLRTTHGDTLSTTRDSITFDVRGLGYGAANLTLVARRGRSTDTLVVSRLGRTRY